LTVSREHLALIVVLAILIYLTRIVGLLLGARQVPPVVARALHYVPIAAFTALIVPGLAVPVEIAPRLVAAVCTGAVALRLGKLWAALLVGMAVYWGFGPRACKARPMRAVTALIALQNSPGGSDPSGALGR